MKVLIIGGMGVIGGAITTAASKHGHDITVVSRRELTSEWNLPGVCGISGNWKDKDFASNVVKEVFDVIVDTQVFDVKQIIRSMDIVNGHCKQYIYISTDSVYKHPAMELREDEPIDFKDIYWDYGIKKREAELYLLNNGDRYDFNWSVIRPTITFGNTRIPVGYASRRNTYTLAERILSGKPIIRFDNPDSRHAVCHTSVFGEATVGMFLNEKAYGQFLHISDDYAFTYGEIFEAIESALGKKGIYISVPTDSIKNLSRNVYEEMVYDKNPDFILDNSKIKDISPNVNYLIDMKEAMKEVLDKYPALDGVFCTNAEVSEMFLEVNKDTGENKVAMVGVDATSKQQEAIQKGEELGVLSQNPYAMGYQTMWAAIQSTAPKKETKIDKKVLLDPVWIDAENIKSEDIANYLYN